MQWYAIFLVGSFIPFLVVSADKSDIIIKSVKESWISSDDFATMLQVSFNTSKCCNVFIYGQSAAIENIVREFVRIYPYEYQLNSKTYDCTGYFMIAASAETISTQLNRVPTTISTTEVLIVLDDGVEEGSRLLNVSVYQNSKVNIVALDGLWTLSEFFLSPRVFKKVSSYHQMMHHQGILDLRGRELQVATFYKPPLCYLKTTVNRTVNGIDEEFFITSNQTELDGIEVKLFMLIADKLNFTWTVRRPKNGDRYGTEVQNGKNWTGGLIGQIFHKEVDIAFGSVWIVLNQYPFANITQPWGQLSVHFLVPRPKPHRSFWALVKPLSLEVWCAIFITLIAQSICICMWAQIDPRIPKRFHNFATTWTEMMGRLVGTHSPRSIQGLKLQFQLWHFVGILLVTAYSCKLAARLASVGFEKRIDTLRDFIEANLTWGLEGPTPKHSNYFNPNDEYGRQFPLHYRQETNETERHSKILSGKYAIIGRIFAATFIPDEAVRDEDLASYRLMKESTCWHSTTFLVQPWLLQSVDAVVLQLLSSGLVEYHIEDVLYRRTKNVLREVLHEYDGSEGFPRVLDLKPLGVGFLILILGLSVSTLIFYIELKFGKENKSLRTVLLEVKTNRDTWHVKQLKRKRGYPIKVQIEIKPTSFSIGTKKLT